MLLNVTNFNVVISVVGGWLVLVGAFSHLLSDKLYLSEALVSLVGGVTFTHVAKLFKPGDYVVSEDAVASVTLDLSRLVLGVQLVLEGIRLPGRYLRTEWRPLAVLLGPGMLGMWASSSAVIWLLVPGLPPLHALAVAACITPTDPVLSGAIVKGRFAEEKVPEPLRHVIVAESGANDGLGYPFLFAALFLIKYAAAGSDARDGGAATALRLFLGQTCVYVVLLSVLYGAAVGLLARGLLAWAERHKLVAREHFLLFPVGLAIFVVGTCGAAGSDDVLACFIAGNAFTWDGWFRAKTLDDPLQPSVEALLNLGVFMWFGAVCPWGSFWSSGLVPPARLFALGALVLLLRRIPTVLCLHPFVRQIQGRQDAMFVGFFGPIGVSAIFYLYVGLEFLETVSAGDGQREDAKQLGDTMMVVIWFLVICSIVVHGLSVPLAKLASHLSGLVRPRRVALPT
ncbi:hypothetical protein KVR01_007918 [Diaporthe batatas]|uniref:uncharacterized protein n=1 Tax=Diaporthe batatas TaxID=748121 RepID=UPI001D04FF61|nr:uncharacterized protein KVR01_007918 [Diaporthe batatas]KAG8162153.1 hypothetical protein KVR01_007918 [Diaporthe batatas]